jgi:hypothetical protein
MRAATAHPPSPVGPLAAKICETWPQYVRAAFYTDPNSLDAIYAWVRELRDGDQLQPGVQFTIEDDPGLPGGVRRGALYDPNADPVHRWGVLRCGWYLVHHGDKSSSCSTSTPSTPATGTSSRVGAAPSEPDLASEWRPRLRASFGPTGAMWALVVGTSFGPAC